ncbi:MAG: efflux RND transporter periplasmic adaptor subunit [Thermoanaerobaculia bacterium]
MTEERMHAEDPGGDDELALGLSRRRRRLRWWSLAVGLLIVAGAGFAVFHLAARDANGAPTAADDGGEDGEGEDKAPIPVEVAAAERGAISAYLSATANLVAEDQVTVVSEVEGRVTSLAVEEGDSVGHGAVLAVLDREDEQMAVAKAEARFENARAVWERGEDLFAKELLSRESHDQLRADHEVASQELAEARWQLEKNTFRAPFAGQLTERMIQVGQHVRPGDALFQVTKFEPLIARIFLPETDVVSLDAGREVRITLNADPSVRFTGRIRQISPVVDTATGTVKITIEAVDPPTAVRSGSFVAIDIVRETREAAILLPKEAVIRELQASHVFIVEDDKAVKRSVRVGLEEGDRIEALDGVTAGERVVTAGQGGLKDGQEIRVLGDEPATS